MPKWSAIVYARTYEVDFRFIAVPKNFTADDQDWFWNYAHTTLDVAEKLPGNPRWFLFSNDSYCTVGVTCMASELLGASVDTLPDDVTKDFKGRPLYLCVGYVAEVDKHGQLPIPWSYSKDNLQAFRNLYSYVQDQWFTKPYHPSSKIPIRSEYQEQIYSSFENFNISNPEFFALNNNASSATAWPDSEKNRHLLWRFVSHYVLSGNGPTSLCLGLESSRNVINVSFLNVTIKGISKKETIAHLAPVASNSARLLKTKEMTEEEHLSSSTGKTNRLYGKKTGGALLGALLTSKVASIFGTPKLIVLFVSIAGGSAGWIIGSLLANRNSAEEASKQTFRESGTSHDPFSGNPTTPHKKERSELDIAYGFRRKRHQNKLNSTEQDSDWF